MHSISDKRGQMTVELAIVFPVMIIVAVIAVNALQFFAACAEFDRATCNKVRVTATSPEYDQNYSRICAVIREDLKRTFRNDRNIEISLAYRNTGLDFDEYTATLKFYPTLFGMNLKREVWGVELPVLTHSSRYVVDTYKPGIVV